MNRLSSFAILLFLSVPAFGQDITRQVYDSLRKVVNKTEPVKERIEPLLTLAQFHIFKPDEQKIDLDSASSFIAEAERLNKSVNDPTLYGYQVLTEAILLREKNQREQGKQMSQKAINILETGNNKNYLGKAYYELSNYYEYNTTEEDFYKKLHLVESSVAAFQQTNNIQEKAYCMKMLGDLYMIEAEFQKAITVLNQALAAYDSINYTRVHGIYDLLGRIYAAQNDYAHAIQYEQLALRAALASRDSSMQLCAINNTLGMVYRAIGRTELAVKYIKDALAVAIKHDDRRTITLLAYHISLCYCDLEQPQQALDILATLPEQSLDNNGASEKCWAAMAYLGPYVAIGQYQQALKYCNILLKLVDEPTVFERTKNTIYHAVASYYFGTRQFDRARFYLSKNLAIIKNSDVLKPIPGDYKLWYEMDSTEGNYRSAFQHLLTYKALNDSVSNVIKARQFNQLEIEYETAKKNDSLKLKDAHISLLTSTNDLQTANLKQADLIKNITISGIVLAAIIIILLYRQYRHKQQSNKVISHKNEQLQHLLTEKEWLLKEVHHRVKNNLQTVVSLLELQPDSIQNEALSAVRDSRNRIYAMSLVHQKLYQSENIASVNLPSYLVELTNYLQEIYQTGGSIRMLVHVIPVELDVSQAIPVGLIVNEAVTNCIKYAFKGSVTNPEITISLKRKAGRQLELIISDNGTGLPASFEKTKNGFGLRLMKGLAEDIDGEFNIESGKGTTIHVSFLANIPFHEFNNEKSTENAVVV